MVEYKKSLKVDGNLLAEIRASTMKPSLLKLGQYDEKRVRDRFLDNFIPEHTFKIIEGNNLLGFYVVLIKDDHHYLDHLYIKPEYQNKKLGSTVLNKLISNAKNNNLPIRLGALKGSRSNDFYIKNNFIKTHEDEFDIYYEYSNYN